MGSTQVRQPLDQMTSAHDLFSGIDFSALDPALQSLATQISSDSALEAASNRSGEKSSSRGDSWEIKDEPDEVSRRLGSNGPNLSRLSAAANSKNRAAQKRYRERQKGKMETYRQQVEELGRRLGLLQTENESLEKRNRLLEKVVQMKDQKPKQPAAQSPQAFEESSNSIWQNVDTYAAVADYVNTIRKNRQPVVTPQEAAHISPEDLRQVKVEYVKELATLLLAHGDETGSAGHRELEDYVLQARLVAINLLTSMSVRSFAQVLALKKRLALNGSISERIMLAMKLSPDQKRDYVAARKALVRRNEDIKEKRRRIIADLELAVPSVAPLMCGQTSAMLRSCESSDQFKASLEEEHRSMVQFHIDCVQLLTPLQEARALLEAHPGNPDPWLISGYLEAEQNGCLAQWLQNHTTGSASQQQQQPEASAPGVPLSTPFEAAPAASFPAIPEDRSGQSRAGENGFSQAVGTGLPMNAPNLEPLQSTPQGLADLLSSPSLDPLYAGFEGLDQDDMWVDFFPGLLTQTAR